MTTPLGFGMRWALSSLSLAWNGSFGRELDDAALGMRTAAIPTARTAVTPQELRREVDAGYFLTSPCMALVDGSRIILPSTKRILVTIDHYGNAIMNLPAPGLATLYGVCNNTMLSQRPFAIVAFTI